MQSCQVSCAHRFSFEDTEPEPEQEEDEAEDWRGGRESGAAGVPSTWPSTISAMSGENLCDEAIRVW